MITSSTKILPSWKYFLVIVFAIVAVYIQTLDFDFVNYDDYELVYHNTDFLSSISNIPTSFTTHAFASQRTTSVYYRPILIISYIIDYHVWKLNPLGYHLTNIILHCLTAIFVFLLIESLLKEKFVSLLASLFFALHPLQIESVAWIAGRNDILLGLFIVMAMYFYIIHFDNPSSAKTYLSLTILAFTLALFTKESAVFFILLFPLYDLVIRKTPLRTLFARPSLLKFIPLVISLGLYLLIRYRLFGEVIGAEKLYGKVSFSGRIQLIPAFVAEQFTLLLFPLRLSIEHPLDKVIWVDSPMNIVAFLIMLTFIAIVWWSILHQSSVVLGMIWLCLGLVPTLNFFPMAVPILEHRLYVVIVGFALVMCYTMYQKFKQPFGTAILIITITAAGIGSYLRAPVWQNSEQLWTDAIKKAPTAHRSYFNLAVYYFDRQQYNITIEILKKYIELKPNDFAGYSKLRQTYFITGQYENAVKVCRDMIAIQPYEQSRYVDLGTLFEKMNLPDSAINLYKEGLHVDSSFYQLHLHLGKIYHNRNNLKEAEHYYRQAIRIKPDLAPAYFSLGISEVTLGNDNLALQLIEEGTKYENPPPDVKQILLYLLQKNTQLTTQTPK